MRKRNKLFLKAGIIVFSIILIIIATVFILKNYAENTIRDKIHNDLVSGHIVNTAKVDLNIINRTIIIESIIIVPDTIGSKTDSIADYVIDSALISSLHINRIGILRYLIYNKLNIGRIEFDDSYISVSLSKHDSKDKKTRDDNNIGHVLINGIILNNASIKLKDLSSGRSFLSVKNLSLTTGKFEINSEEDTLLIEFPEIEKLNTKGIYSYLQGGFYKLEIGEIINEGDLDFSIYDFKLLPQYKKYVFSKKIGYQTDRVKILLDELRLSGFEYTELSKNIIRCHSVKAENIFADFFRDKNIERRPDYYPPMPQQMLTNLDFKLMIDSVIIDNSDVHYIEHEHGAPQPGFVFFSDLNVCISNLNNDPALFKTGRDIHTYATGKVMGESLAELKIKFPANPTPDTIFFSGELDSMNLNYFNSMLERNQLVRINDGYLNKISFDASGNDNYATGKLKFLYDDLNITVLKIEDKVSTKDRKFFSFIMNRVIRKHNPRPDHSSWIAEMSFERDKEKSFINFLWKTILSGITETIKPGKENLEKEVSSG